MRNTDWGCVIQRALALLKIMEKQQDGIINLQYKVMERLNTHWVCIMPWVMVLLKVMKRPQNGIKRPQNKVSQEHNLY